jgi:acetyltransferase-like isoleucine patch superfamily enzyme
MILSHVRSLIIRYALGDLVTIRGNVTFGKKVNVMRGSILYAHNGGLLVIGNNVTINHYTIIDSSFGEIKIGSNVIIGPFNMIRASNHEYLDADVLIRNQGHRYGKITIGNDVWIGGGVRILPNVNVGDGSVIAAGAVVTNDVEEYTVVAGIPARKIGTRLTTQS